MVESNAGVSGGFVAASRRRPLTTLVVFNGVIMVTSAVVGWAVTTARWADGNGLFVPGSRDAMAVLPLALRLGMANLFVMVRVVLAAVTCGLYPLVVVVFNAHGVGELFANMRHVYGDRAWVLLTYAPLELGALAIAAGVSQRLSILVLRLLIHREGMRLRPLLNAVAVSVGLLAVAALIEAHWAQEFAYRPR